MSQMPPARCVGSDVPLAPLRLLALNVLQAFIILMVNAKSAFGCVQLVLLKMLA